MSCLIPILILILKLGGLLWRIANFLLRVCVVVLKILLKPLDFLLSKKIERDIQEGKRLLTSYSLEEYSDNEYSELRGYPSSAVMDLEDEGEENETQ